MRNDFSFRMTIEVLKRICVTLVLENSIVSTEAAPTPTASSTPEKAPKKAPVTPTTPTPKSVPVSDKETPVKKQRGRPRKTPKPLNAESPQPLATPPVTPVTPLPSSSLLSPLASPLVSPEVPSPVFVPPKVVRQSAKEAPPAEVHILEQLNSSMGTGTVYWMSYTSGSNPRVPRPFVPVRWTKPDVLFRAECRLSRKEKLFYAYKVLEIRSQDWEVTGN